MNALIVDSILRRKRIRFVYNDKLRIVEPQCYGIGKKGTELLRAHQIEGGSEREPLFDVQRIVDLRMLTDSFDEPGPNYKKNDSAMVQIFCQL